MFLKQLPKQFILYICLVLGTSNSGRAYGTCSENDVFVLYHTVDSYSNNVPLGTAPKYYNRFIKQTTLMNTIFNMYVTPLTQIDKSLNDDISLEEKTGTYFMQSNETDRVRAVNAWANVARNINKKIVQVQTLLTQPSTKLITYDLTDEISAPNKGVIDGLYSFYKPAPPRNAQGAPVTSYGADLRELMRQQKELLERTEKVVRDLGACSDKACQIRALSESSEGLQELIQKDLEALEHVSSLLPNELQWEIRVQYFHEVLLIAKLYETPEADYPNLIRILESPQPPPVTSPLITAVINPEIKKISESITRMTSDGDLEKRTVAGKKLKSLSAKMETLMTKYRRIRIRKPILDESFDGTVQEKHYTVKSASSGVRIVALRKIAEIRRFLGSIAPFIDKKTRNIWAPFFWTKSLPKTMSTLLEIINKPCLDGGRNCFDDAISALENMGPGGLSKRLDAREEKKKAGIAKLDMLQKQYGDSVKKIKAALEERGACLCWHFPTPEELEKITSPAGSEHANQFGWQKCEWNDPFNQAPAPWSPPAS